MLRRLIILAILVLAIAGCAQEPATTPAPQAQIAPTETAAPPAAPTEAPTELPPTAVPPTATQLPPTAIPPTALPPTETAAPVPVVLPEFDGQPLPKSPHTYFSGSGSCSLCHDRQTDAAGSDVSIASAWRGSSMALAAQDPYWLASVSAEIDIYPELAAVIEDTCATCHMPMARFTAVDAGGGGQMFDGGFTDPQHELYSLAKDGVSCTLCHQIEPDNFDDPASFGGGYQVDTAIPSGQRPAYGRFAALPRDAMQMSRASGFNPVQSDHMADSALCATCHMLYTPSINDAGEIAGSFPEQMVYLEWELSDYAAGPDCLDCHMPAAAGAVPVANSGSPAREPFRQHTFAGGNSYLIQLFQHFGPELGATAGSEELGASRLQAEALLSTQTAALTIDALQVAGDELSAILSINSQAGHKFPTSYPSRRAWIHFTVQDGSGAVVFESGAVSANGAVSGNDNDADPFAYEPHYQTITEPDQVQIYEAILVGSDNHVTTTLLRAASYIKDNRILPAGFDKASAPADVAVNGLALDDDNFSAGGDTISYRIDLAGSSGPYTVTAELLYQAIGYRWAMNLEHHDTAEVGTFLDLYESVPNWPVPVSSAAAVTP